MASVPDSLLDQLQRFKQGHLLSWWQRLDDTEQRELVSQMQSIDFSLIHELFSQRERVYSLPAADRIIPIPVTVPAELPVETKTLGEQALKQGEVAVLVVAGGQGTRLDFNLPKGMFPIGPVSQKSLFQIHAEKVLALVRKFGRAIPFLVMTSPATDHDTRQFFQDNSFFGLDPEDVHFFVQGTMPAVDLASGQLLMEKPHRLFLSPNGHGGTLLALADSGLLDRLQHRGIRHLFYFQVDNPLVKVADLTFLGHHVATQSEASSKIVAKQDPKDKLGNLVLIDGRCSIIEYSDLPSDLANEHQPDGTLRIAAGSPAIHIFTLEFLDRVSRGRDRIPFHLAKKKVPCLDGSGNLTKPQKENALKFEMFIFDALPKAQRWAVLETNRREEFEPVKNLSGAESPESARQAISNLAGHWLERAGVAVPRTADGKTKFPLEISPLFAVDIQELTSKVDHGLQITGPTYLR